ncbi:MAG: rod shape-determining protein MreD [Paludibacteraceae bacterium]|nr:rod shape-determining protein MreD [Paludibacteraceae bacterium]
MNNVLRHIVRFVLLFALQDLLFNNLHWLGICHPYVYLIGLLMLPVSLPRWAEMLIGTVTGLVMDMLCSTTGVHMAACVALSYARPLLIDRFIQDAQRISTQTDSQTMGNRFTILAIMLIALHHSIVFVLEAWSFEHIGWLVTSIVLSSLITFILTFLYDKAQR